MPKFTVLVREVHVSHREVEAKDEKEALKKIVEDNEFGEETYCEFSHTLDPEYWTVEPSSPVVKSAER